MADTLTNKIISMLMLLYNKVISVLKWIWVTVISTTHTGKKTFLNFLNNYLYMSSGSQTTNFQFVACDTENFTEVGPSLVDNTYTNNLEALSKIRESCGGKLNLPQIVVIGSTSQGKSTVLGLITGLKFPSSTDVCTIAPCVVECIRDITKSKDEYYITDPTTKENFMFECLKTLAEKIHSIQNTLGKDGANNKQISEKERINYRKQTKLDSISSASYPQCFRSTSRAFDHLER